MNPTAEQARLEQSKKNNPWKKWGPYLTERQWGTVREDYSADGAAWEFTPHEHARSRAYRWGEEGIAGISDAGQLLCFAMAFWNGKDPILKERIFGLTGNEGNHGEDAKEYYYYLDSTPTHSYMKHLFKYSQQEFPYAQLVQGNRNRSRLEPEYELMDTGVFDDNKYFDIYTEYAKADTDDLLIKVTVVNRGKHAAELHVIPTVWFRNTWAWEHGAEVPKMYTKTDKEIGIEHAGLGKYTLYLDGKCETQFCNNETNFQKLYGSSNPVAYVKDGINNFIVNGEEGAVNPDKIGTKASGIYRAKIKANEEAVFRFRLSANTLKKPFENFDSIFAERLKEADEFYHELQKDIPDRDTKNVQRQAFAGMLWGKQFFYYNIKEWLQGDPTQVAPPESRKHGRNSHWRHLRNADIVSMPDKWEYPWYAVWDSAFHCIPLARIDIEFAKDQLLLFLQDNYLHPNGQIPAYEWNFDDVNPPVHAWSVLRIFQIDKSRTGKGDFEFLEQCFHRLMLNFTWWVNRKDTSGNNIFEGGFLGLDNIGVFDRSRPLPTGGYIEQADGTAWMAMYSLNMLRISLELALEQPVYESMASKFFEHFMYIAGALNNVGKEDFDLWDEEDDFYYDILHTPDGNTAKLKVRSMVGLIPLFAVETLKAEAYTKLPKFRERMEYFYTQRPDLAELVSRFNETGKDERKLLSLVRGFRMKKVIERLADETEFLSEYGVRALSKYHQQHPYEYHFNHETWRVSYLPGESDSGMFGGNSNWRGPIWMPVNYMIIESLNKFYHYYGDDFKVEFPKASGKYITLAQLADELRKRLIHIFTLSGEKRGVYNNHHSRFNSDPHFRDNVLFYEYFHGDDGSGVGASHQTGWTGLIADIIHKCPEC